MSHGNARSAFSGRRLSVERVRSGRPVLRVGPPSVSHPPHMIAAGAML